MGASQNANLLVDHPGMVVQRTLVLQTSVLTASLTRLKLVYVQPLRTLKRIHQVLPYAQRIIGLKVLELFDEVIHKSGVDKHIYDGCWGQFLSADRVKWGKQPGAKVRGTTRVFGGTSGLVLPVVSSGFLFFKLAWDPLENRVDFFRVTSPLFQNNLPACVYSFRLGIF